SVKSTGSESDLLVRWTGDQARMISEAQTLGACDVLLLVLPSFLGSLTAIAVLALGGEHVIVGSLSIGLLLAFQSLLAGFNQPFQDLARLGAQAQELRADLDRIDDVRNRAIDVVFSAIEPVGAKSSPRTRDPQAPAAPRLDGHLEFRRVTFGYNRLVDE